MARTERESDRRRREEKWQICWAAETSKERAEWRRLQRKNLSILGLPKRKEWPQCHRESSWQKRRSHLCQKEKEQSRLSRVPDHEEGGSQGGREPHQEDLQSLGFTPSQAKPEIGKEVGRRRARS